MAVSFNDGSGQAWRGIVAPEHGEAAYYIRTSRWGGVKEWPPPGTPPVREVAVKEKAAEAPKPVEETRPAVKQNISSSVYDR